MYGSNSVVIANVLSPVQDSYPQHIAKIFLCPGLESIWLSEFKFVYNLISGCFFLERGCLNLYWLHMRKEDFGSEPTISILRLQLKCCCILGFCHNRDKLNKLIGSEKLPLSLFYSLFHQHLPVNFLQQFALNKSPSKMMSRFRISKI